MNAPWLRDIFVTGFKEFLHDLKREYLAGTLTKQSAETSAVSSAVEGVASAAETLFQGETSKAPVIAQAEGSLGSPQA